MRALVDMYNLRGYPHCKERRMISDSVTMIHGPRVRIGNEFIQ